MKRPRLAAVLPALWLAAFCAVPFLLVAIGLVAIKGSPSLVITVLVIAFFSWAGMARIIRGQVLSLREREFVEAARSLGASSFRIMFICARKSSKLNWPFCSFFACCSASRSSTTDCAFSTRQRPTPSMPIRRSTAGCICGRRASTWSGCETGPV